MANFKKTFKASSRKANRNHSALYYVGDAKPLPPGYIRRGTGANKLLNI